MAALEDLFKLYVFPTGRRVTAHRTVHDIATELGLAAIVTHTDASIRHDTDVTGPLEHAWHVSRAQRRGRKPVDGDLRVDAILAAIYRVARSHARLEGLPQAAAARDVLKMFPGGLRPLTHRVQEEQHIAVSWLIERFEAELAPAIDALGLREVVVQLSQAHALVEAALVTLPEPRGAPWERMREAQAEGQRRLLQTLALCLAAFPWDTPEDTAKRGRLLRPILEHNEELRQARKKHGRTRKREEPAG